MKAVELKDYLEAEGAEFIKKCLMENGIFTYTVYKMKFKDIPFYIWSLYSDEIAFISTNSQERGFEWKPEYGYNVAEQYYQFLLHFKELEKLKDMKTDFE